jgi:hypothetical protein
MTRWTAGMLYLFCAVALVFAQTPEKKSEVGQSAAAAPARASKEPAAPAKGKAGLATRAAAPSSKLDYPLDAFKNFSAVMIGSMAGDEDESHIYRLGQLMRTDVGTSYAVTDLTKGDTYGVSPKGCLHDAHPAYRVFPFGASRHGQVTERTDAGKEAVDGHSTRIEDVTIGSKIPGGSSLKLRLWEAEDLQGFPIKIEVLRAAKRQVIIRYKDVVLAPPDPALFKHPKSCQVLNPGAVPKFPKAAPAAKKPAAAPSTDSSNK